MTTFVTDPAWRAQPRDEGVVVYAGADQTYLIPDLTRHQVDGVTRLFEQDAIDPAEIAEDVRPLLPRLRSLGALRPAVLPSRETPRRLRVGVRATGPLPTALTVALYEAFPPVASPELDLVVRTAGTLRDLASLAAELTRPHLLLDLAYHHTISLGPLVVPGATACLACLAVRSGRRWGDPPPPERPSATDCANLAVALAEHALRRLWDGSLALTDRVVSHHLDELTTTSEHVLPSAACPVCPGFEVGKTVLPWEAA
ncbi:hypothetical protein [Amycolatopsis sp. CA-230715]|uniref:hypothetical protein n=1 Tax=Amycolatopsis sp. CA-230715 TaxID=2745196 RepID=UPI001C009545|nr:hypothetical protein [Amycolatopsis sp. CA-230715]QWF77053.1 hypothetical protein HUW46_00433 [Amycolatopsis sp. CA-230715]